jgi:hypothetical protein
MILMRIKLKYYSGDLICISRCNFAGCSVLELKAWFCSAVLLFIYDFSLLTFSTKKKKQ